MRLFGTAHNQTSAADRDEARFLEQTAAHYRDWLTYLQAQLMLLDIRRAHGGPAFEASETRSDDMRAATATLKALEPKARALYDAVFESERQHLQAEMHQAGRAQRELDPDEIARQALQTLSDDAHGATTDDRRGLLPRGTPDNIKWYTVDAQALLAAPTPASYQVAQGGQPDRRRIVRSIGLFAAVVLLVLLYLARPTTTNSGQALNSTLTVNGVPVEPWAIDALTLERTDHPAITLPVTVTATFAWPAAAANQSTLAYWSQSQLRPLRLCVPGALLKQLQMVRLVGSGETPVRIFRIQPQPDRVADLVLDACGSTSGAATYSGVLQTTEALANYAPGASVVLNPTQQLTVDTVSITGQGQDVTLPAGQARVSVNAHSTQPLDWPLLAPTLLLPSGQALLPGETHLDGIKASFHYVIPVPQQVSQAVWSISPAADRPVIRWRFTLAVPPSRAQVLAEALDVRAVAVQPGPNTSAGVTITLANRSAAPLQLHASDFTLRATDGVVPIPDLPALHTPLAPTNQRVIMLAIPTHRGNLLLTIGQQQYRIIGEGG